MTQVIVIRPQNKKAWSEGGGWQPIGSVTNPFVAIFDGNGYVISNLTIKTSDYNVGLFGSIGNAAIVDHVSLSGIDISGAASVGSVVGSNSGGTVNNSHATGSLTGDEMVGGLVGFMIDGVINNSYARVNVEGDMLVGGLVGYDLRGMIRNVYTHGKVGGNGNVGGLVGFASDSTLINGYAIGKVSADGDAGGLIGSGINLDSEAITSSYWNMDENELGNSLYGIALTAAQLKSPTAPGTTSTEAYYNWQISDWDFGNKLQYPVLKDADGNLLPYQRVGLLSLALSHSAKLSPSFDTETFNYDVTVAAGATHIRLLPAALHADIYINDSKTANGKLSFPIALHPSTTTVITISVATKNVAPILYTLNVNNHFPQVTIAAIPRREISEGESVLLDVSSKDPNGDMLIYRWSQNTNLDILSDANELSGVIEKQGDANLSFVVPENLLTATQDTDEAEFNLTVEDGKARVDKNISLHIIKKNNGTIAGFPSPTLRDRSYVAPVVETMLSQDPDGAAYPSTIRYQWQKYERSRWVDINGETGTSYTPQEAEINQPYRIFVRYTDNQGHRESIASDKTVVSTFEMTISKIYIHIKVFLEGLLSE